MLLMATSNASGAALAGSLGFVSIIVDIIDFSTSMEAAIEAGAAAVYGASPDHALPPAKINPFAIGVMAGKKANLINSEVILVAEPRIAGNAEKTKSISKALAGLKSTGARVHCLIPNIGAESTKLVSFKDKVVLGITGAGGVAFDAAVNSGSPSVLTGTVARTMNNKGDLPGYNAVQRAIASAAKYKTGIAVVAASSKSMEDILAAEHIYKLILKQL